MTWLLPWAVPQAIRRRLMLTCPCCHGKGHVNKITHDDAKSRTVLTHMRCHQCDGTGEIEEL
jgi:DnaJ-class molecular chaperone